MYLCSEVVSHIHLQMLNSLHRGMRNQNVIVTLLSPNYPCTPFAVLSSVDGSMSCYSPIWKDKLLFIVVYGENSRSRKQWQRISLMFPNRTAFGAH